jgi:lysophospholipase L1-like esterase
MLKKLLAGAAVITALVCILEAGLRLPAFDGRAGSRYMRFCSDKGFEINDGIIPATHFLFSRDPYLFWRLKYIPGEIFHQVTPNGFRGKEPGREKTGNTYRIFCIGDSCTFGMGVKYYEAYPFVLEELLNGAGGTRKFEVVNAGVPGYSSFQAARHLERDILQYKPDLVIASFGWNDTMLKDCFTDKEQKSPASELAAADLFFRQFKTYLFIERIERTLVSAINGVFAQAGAVAENPVRVPKADFRDNLARICELGGRNGFKVIFFNQPARNAKPHEYSDTIKLFCSMSGVDFVNMADVFYASAIPGAELFNDFNHESPRGHRLIAETLLRLLKKRGI